jgi:hypothetical protein
MEGGIDDGLTRAVPLFLLEDIAGLRRVAAAIAATRLTACLLRCDVP